MPVVLCDLEGKSHKEAARFLGCPPGTLSVRLMRARTLLARRLARHGLVWSGISLAALRAEGTASAGVPGVLMGSTVKAAIAVAAGRAPTGLVSAQVVALTEGVLQAMFLTKLTKVVGVLLVVLVVATGTGLVFTDLRASAPEDQNNKTVTPTVTPKEATVSATTVEILSAYGSNEALADEKFTGRLIRVTGTMMVIKRSRKADEPVYLLSLAHGAPARGASEPPAVPLVFEFGAKDRKQLAAIKRHQEMTIEGYCQGVTEALTEKPSILIRKCKILDTKPRGDQTAPGLRR